MISFLEGKVIHKNSSFIVLQVGGVGYKVFATPDILSEPVEKTIRVFTHHKSTDDGQSLFGMPGAAELDFFELLLSVSGVGPKIALAIISAAKIDVLKNAIQTQDASFFSQVSGVGKKTAERIIVELKNKLGELPGLGGASGGSELFDALSGLGYSSPEIRDILPRIDLTKPTDHQIKTALQILKK